MTDLERIEERYTVRRGLTGYRVLYDGEDQAGVLHEPICSEKVGDVVETLVYDMVKLARALREAGFKLRAGGAHLAGEECERTLKEIADS